MVHPTLYGNASRTKLSFVDDFNQEGVFDVAKDIQTIIVVGVCWFWDIMNNYFL